MITRLCFYLFFILSLLVTNITQADGETKLTVLYDAFGKPSQLIKDWGFSLLVKHNGKQFLFDTGNNGDILANNFEVSGVDASQLAFAIISHRHGDHMGGLSFILAQRPELDIYAPKEGFGIFGASLPGDFYPANPALPPEMRYFDGKAPEQLFFGKAWPQGEFHLITQTTEIASGIHLIILKGEWGTDLALQELSLVLESEKGLIVIVGCSHPTIEKIVDTAKAEFGKPVYLVIGGTHLLPAAPSEIHRIADALKSKLAVDWIAPAHCTGEPAFEILRDSYQDHYLYAGLGTTITIDTKEGISSSETMPEISDLNTDTMGYRLLSTLQTFDN